MAATRSATRTKKSVTKKYRARLANSQCRGKKSAPCNNTRGCKMSAPTNKRKSYCRKSSNQKL